MAIEADSVFDHQHQTLSYSMKPDETFFNTQKNKFGDKKPSGVVNDEEPKHMTINSEQVAQKMLIGSNRVEDEDYGNYVAKSPERSPKEGEMNLMFQKQASVSSP